MRPAAHARLLIPLLAVLLSGATALSDGAAADIDDFLACLEDTSAAMVSAHRGGPAPGYPENALATLKRGAAAGLRMFEVDVATARNGVLLLMHDRTLDRTTTGAGPVAAADWDDIRALRLKDNDGNVTPFAPPSLREALAWAAESDVYLTLDIKGEADAAAIAEAVAAAGMGDRVIYLARSLEQTRRLLALTPDAMASVAPDAVQKGAIAVDRAVVWTGFRDFDPARIAALDDAGLYVNFGTLGFGDSYDDRIAASGDDSAYTDFADAGLHVISSDRPLAARAALRDAGRSWDSAPACRP